MHERTWDRSDGECPKCGGILFISLDPWETPIFSMLPKTKASGMLHEWVLDELAG